MKLNHLFSRSSLRLLSLIALIFHLMAPAQAAPGDQPMQRLVRSAQSGSSLETILSKNHYRQEAFEAEYTVQVPYETTEAYVVDIPYETIEHYTDYEQQCRSEHRCHDRHREQCNVEPVCRAIPDRECRQERVCRPHPDQPRCEEVTECGTNALGERICKTRKVCRGGGSREDCGMVERCESRTREECRQERRCHTVPDRQCGFENVCESVPVNRTRTVTKYRQETRTRTVTKTRTETRCCQTQYRQVFDRQDQLSVHLNFPAEAQLLPQETEVFEVKLVGSSSRLDVDFRALAPIFGYRVAKKDIKGSHAEIDLAPVAKHTEQELGVSTIQKLQLQVQEAGVSVLFVDLGQRSRVQTEYEVLVKTLGEAVVARAVGLGTGAKEVSLSLDASLDINQTYLLEIRVQRSGPVLAGPIDFTHQVTAKVESIANLDPYKDLSLVLKPRLEGSESGAQMLFRDLSPVHPAVKSTYHLKILRQSGFLGSGRKELVQTVLSRESLTLSPSGDFQIPLLDLGIRPKDLEKHVKSGDKLSIELTVIRQSSLFGGLPEIRFSLSHEIRVP
jgi:hypothetical protein